MWVEIDRYNHGCCGIRYKSQLEAIKDGAWKIWDEERVRRMHNFGHGTMKDHEHYCKNNNCDVVSMDKFWSMTKCLGPKWREDAEEFIKKVLR